jgi:hypothetical protein
MSKHNTESEGRKNRQMRFGPKAEGKAGAAIGNHAWEYWEHWGQWNPKAAS